MEQSNTLHVKGVIMLVLPMCWLFLGVTTSDEHPNYCQVSNMRRTLIGNKIVDHSDEVGASPVGAAPTTSSFSTSLDWAKTTARRDEKHLNLGI